MQESTSSTPSDALTESATEWLRHLTVLTSLYIFFESITGFAVHLLPFGVTAQSALLFHVGVGLVLTPVYLVYQVKHYLRLQPRPVTHVKFVGYVLAAILLTNIVTGVQVAIEAAFGRSISGTADMLHLITGYATFVLVVSHLAVVWALHRKQARAAGHEELLRAPGRHMKRAGWLTGALLLVLAASILLAPEPDTSWELPEGYSYPYGDNPFAPSLAQTEHGGAINPVTLANSRSCGTENCHEEILAEWLPSAHRYASMDAAFQGVQAVMAQNEGPESTRYCAGCHDPIALFSGSKNIYSEDLSSFGADEGISCLGCHAITETDIQGNANYVIAEPSRYLFEYAQGGAGQFLSNFLIRAYPQEHIRSYKRDLYKTPEFCGACHKQFIDKRINKGSWVQLQNQYDNWKTSHWNQGEGPEDRITCNECHMRLVDSEDPASGDELDYNRTEDDGKHRHHGFIASNQFIPKHHNLEGWEKHVALTQEWLRGDTILPEIATKYREGPVVPIRIEAPSTVKAGEEFKFSVVIHSNKVGHDFPTGPLDIIQCWLEIDMVDADGKVLFHSGSLDERGFLQEASFLFKAEGVDRQGNLIDRHNLWEMVGARFRRALFPDHTDTARYQVLCPSTALSGSEKKKLPERESHSVKAPDTIRGPLTVKAKLNYRKFNQFLLNYMFGREDLTAPVVVLSTSEFKIDVKKAD